MQVPKLLLVDDDRAISRAIALALRAIYVVDCVADGLQALERLEVRQYAVIILDLNLPGISGLEVCQLLRDGDITTPVLILTGESDTLSKIHLLDAGANDYLTKPFSLGELKARLRVLTRHDPRSRSRPRQLKVGGLVLNRQTRTVTREGVSIPLRRKEFAVLECLMEQAGVVVSRNKLIRHAWPDADEPWTNTIDVHVTYLRNKLDKPFSRPMIETVHGVGYRLAVPQPFTAEKS